MPTKRLLSTPEIETVLMDASTNELIGVATYAYRLYMALEHPDERGTIAGGAEVADELKLWLRRVGFSV